MFYVLNHYINNTKSFGQLMKWEIVNDEISEEDPYKTP